MSPTFALLLLSVVPAQATAGGPALVPQLTRGQELVYRGQFEEDSRADGVPFHRGLTLEIRTLVLDTTPAGLDVAFLTMLRLPGSPPSARLAPATVDTHGRVPLWVPLDGPPTLEPAGFVELPAGRIEVGSVWDVAENNRPPRGWRVEAVEPINGVRCFKLIGTQQSAEWDQPDGTAPAWQRTDVVWLSTQSGTVRKLERTTVRRGDNRVTATRAVTRYGLVDEVVNPERVTDDLRREVSVALQFQQRLAALLPTAGRGGPERFDALVANINTYLNRQPPTVYRPAVLAAKQAAEAAQRGEAPPPDAVAEAPPAPAAVGRLAPDFVAADLRTGAPVRLARWRDRPVVLLFVRPDTAAATVRTAEEVHQRYGDQVHVAVLVTGDEARVRRTNPLGMPVPLLAGSDVAPLYGADSVVIDVGGITRYLGNGTDADSLARVVAEYLSR